MNINSSIRKFIPVSLTLILVLSMLAACTKQGGSKDTERRTLRIAYMYGDSSYDDYMRTQLTDLYAFSNKNIDIEFIPAVDYGKRRYQSYNPDEPYVEPNPIDEMKALIEGDNPPDIILSGFEELQLLIEDNMLQALEPYIEKDEFDIEGLVPSVINGIKEAGNGKLYALSPTFSSSALIYNKAIFNERNVSYPQDGMSWTEIFDLARMVSYGEGQDRVYGFSFTRSYWDDLFNSLDIYVSPLQLQVTDEMAEQMLVDSDQWEKAISDLIRLKQERILPEPPEYTEDFWSRPNPYSSDAFMSGHLAMSITNYNSLNEIISANNNADLIEGYTPIEWDVVTLPTHDDAPGLGGTIYMDPILSISAKAQNTEDAWDFIKFINGKKWAELKSRSLNMLVSHKEFIKPSDGLDYNIAAFYTLTPVKSSMNFNHLKVDPKIRQNIWQINSIGYQKIREITEEDKDVRQALQEWAVEGNAVLKQARENMDSGGGIGIPMPMPMVDVITEEVIID